MVDVSLAALQREFEKLGLSRNDEGLTAAEFCTRWGVSRKTVCDRLKQAKALGWLTTGRKMSERIDGQASCVPCYIIAIPSKKKTKKK
jgi:predicted DNA-binding protein (UPF0251 family)